ncbi:hypothetical protein [Rubrivirga sp. IMCC43871]|uniref:hypothetical protein n=1 Tax=Rubrivirga sp. IMCC43871 TaxID=3391575 RepID=UPI0039902DEC
MTPRLLLLAALALGACSDAFDPRADGGPAFALNGTFDGQATHQRVRVQDLRDSVTDPAEALAATVTSTELVSGATTTWRDSLATLADGTRTHIAVADLAIAAGQTHRLRVAGVDGRESRVDVRLPNPVAVPGPVTTAPATSIRIDLTDAAGRPDESLVRFRVRRADGGGEQTLVATVALQPDGDGATFLIFLSQAVFRARTLLYGNGPGGIVFLGAQLETTLTSTADTPVVGGVGGVGWTLPLVVPIPIPSALVADVGFIDGR